jgi:NAD(P)-dependent dehydrogenase (short-subunit alcohol dehydrogenase family)
MGSTKSTADASGNTVVITGAASGIGEACLRAFADAGAHVIAGDLDAPRGRAIVDELLRKRARCEFHEIDVASEASLAAFAKAVFARHPTVDTLVNSAGVLQNAVRATEMPISEFDRSWNVNVRGTLLASRIFGARMCEAGRGSIVNLCSLTTFRPSAQVAYAMGKASLKMLTEILASEFGPQGVRVNAVAPGYTLTPAMQARIDRGERDPAAVIDKSALRRFVQPSEVADAVLFLCSERASAITGVTLPIDCGWLAYSAYSAYAAQPGPPTPNRDSES